MYLFVHARQLPRLAPYLPKGERYDLNSDMSYVYMTYTLRCGGPSDLCI